MRSGNRGIYQPRFHPEGCGNYVLNVLFHAGYVLHDEPLGLDLVEDSEVFENHASGLAFESFPVSGYGVVLAWGAAEEEVDSDFPGTKVRLVDFAMQVPVLVGYFFHVPDMENLREIRGRYLHWELVDLGGKVGVYGNSEFFERYHSAFDSSEEREYVDWFHY